MAYRRYPKRKVYRRRRRAPASSSWFSTKSFTPQSAYALATQAAKDIWYLKGLVNSEMLKYDISTTSTAVNSSGTIIPLSGIAQGDGDSARTGNSILIRKMLLRMQFYQNAAAANTTFKVLLFMDKQQIGDTAPAVTDVLDSASTLSPLNSNTVGRFNVLGSWLFHTSTDRDTVVEKNFFKDLRTHIRYNGNLGTDIQKNGIYLLMISDQGTNIPTVYYNWRLSYHDN